MFILYILTQYSKYLCIQNTTGFLYVILIFFTGIPNVILNSKFKKKCPYGIFTFCFAFQCS